ncbi:MAG: penicillin-binding protein activator LpoB [Planctomycetaceae bacterium]|nr:penicillin-binding protein activator LpoB [Planctomycetaceae bacterium]
MRLLSVFALLGILSVCLLSGCRGTQARVMHGFEQDKVGSNAAGAEVYNPIVRETVGKLLARAAAEPSIQQVMYTDGTMGPARRKVCFVGLENAGIEEVADFKEHIKTAISEKITESPQFEVVSDRAVRAGLQTLGLRPDDLFMEENMKMFISAMGRGGTPVDYLLFAKITTGTTIDNKDMQRDYKLSLELVNTQTYSQIIESMPMRKEYNNSVKGKFKNWFKK